MSSVNCASFNSRNHEVVLPHSAQAPTLEAEMPVNRAPTPSISPLKPGNQQNITEILIPGKNWEYIAEYLVRSLNGLQRWACGN
jgi:hypothetical protein